MGRTGGSLHPELPPWSGGGSPLQEEPLVGRLRPMEWGGSLLLLNLIISLRIIIVEPGGPRRVVFAWAPCTFAKLLMRIRQRNHWLSKGAPVVVASFSWFSSQDSHDFPLKRNEFSLFLQKLSLLPEEYYTFRKLSRVCIKMVAANFIKSLLFANELYTFSKMSQASTMINFTHLDKLY